MAKKKTKKGLSTEVVEEVVVVPELENAIADAEVSKEEVSEIIADVVDTMNAVKGTEAVADDAENTGTSFVVGANTQSKRMKMVNLFNLVGKKEGIKFVTNEMYYPKTEIAITDKNGGLTKVIGMMIKTAPVYTVTVDTGYKFVAADKHILKMGDETIYVDELKVGDKIKTVTGEATITSVKLFRAQAKVFDLQVEDEEHLYSDASGIIHHNTYDITKEIKASGLTESKDWYLVKGTASAMGVYQQLFEARNGKLIVFDDCDAVLKDEQALNIFKAALDSDKNRKISWKKEANVLFKVTGDMMVLDKKLGSMVPDETNEDWQTQVMDEGRYPNQYMFDGSSIFVSNLSLDNEHIKALKSRSFMIDITIKASDMILRIESIHAGNGFKEALDEYGINPDVVEKVLDMYRAKAEADPDDVSGTLNIRSFTNALTVFAAEDIVGDQAARLVERYGNA